MTRPSTERSGEALLRLCPAHLARAAARLAGRHDGDDVLARRVLAMIGAGAPFTRQALKEFRHYHPDEHAALDAAIPAGHRITLICGYQPRPLGAVLVGPDGIVARVEPRYPTVLSACQAVLAKGREIVVERTDGYVVTAEAS